jgi:hypothetical protein
VSELDLSEDDVREEHLKAVNVPAEWAYFFGVVIGGFILMVLFIALLGAGQG